MAPGAQQNLGNGSEEFKRFEEELVARHQALDLTPFDGHGEKPVSSREGDLAWMQRRNESCMIDSLRSML